GGGGEEGRGGGVCGVVRRKHEGRFAEVELSRKRLHPAVGQAVGVREHRQGIAAETPIRKDIDGHKRKAPHRCQTISTPISAAMRRKPSSERAVALRPSCGQWVSMLARTSWACTPLSKRRSS